MRPKRLTHCIALTLAALTLSACSHRGDTSVSLGDDDTFCRANNVQIGSPEYVACRKDRRSARRPEAAWSRRIHAEQSGSAVGGGFPLARNYEYSGLVNEGGQLNSAT